MGTYSEKIKLTKTNVDAAAPIKLGTVTRQRILFDTKTPGFGVVVGSKTKTFFAQRGNRRVTVGRYGHYTLEQARDLALEELRVLSGHAPLTPKAPPKSHTITLRDGLDLAKKTMKAKGRSERTMSDYAYLMTRYLSDWLDRPLASITREEANAKHHQIVEDIGAGKYGTVLSRSGNTYVKKRVPGSGTYSANAVMRVFRAIYNRVARQYEGFPENPCVNVDFYKEEERDAAIPEKLLARWYKDVMALENPIRRDYLRLVLFSGLRRQSAASIEWDHVDIKGRALLVPNPKGGKDKAFNLPLSDYLVDLLEARRECETTKQFYPDSRFVFPAESKAGYISEPKVKLSVPFKVHGLRHTFVTQAYQLGIPEPIVQVLVNHSVTARSSRKITRGYYTPDFDYLRGPMEQISESLRSLCGAPAKAKAPKAKRK